MPSKGIEAHLNGNCVQCVRAEFEQLYHGKACTLSDIIKHFSIRGVTASKQQWKTQITIWGIRKNSCGSDIVFAAKKARERKHVFGKKTAFIIQGKRRSVRQIDRSAKRLQNLIDSCETVPPTPSGIFYFTPPSTPPVPETKTLRNGCGHATILPNVHPISTTATDWFTELDREVSNGIVNNQSSLVTDIQHLWMPTSEAWTSLGNIYVPTHVNDVELFASSIRSFTGHSLTKVANGLPYFDELTDELGLCFRDIQVAIQSYDAGQIDSARISWNRGLQLLPQVVSSYHIFLLVYIMRFSILSSYEAKKLGGFFLSAAYMVGTRMLGPDNHLVQMLEVMCRSGENKGAIIEMGCSHAVDYLVETVHSDVICLLLSAHRYLGWMRGDWNGVVFHCQQIRSSYERRTFTSKYHWGLDSLLWEARAYLRLRDFVQLTLAMTDIEMIFQEHSEGMDKFREEYLTLCQEYAEVQRIKTPFEPATSTSKPPQNLFLLHIQARK